MPRSRFVRSNDPRYLCSNHGMPLCHTTHHNATDTDAAADEFIHIVHTSEMTADMATALGEAITAQLCAAQTRQPPMVRRPPDQNAQHPSVRVVTLLKPAHEVPGGGPVHLDYTDGVITATYDELKIKKELAVRIGRLAEQASKRYRPGPERGPAPEP